MRDPIAETWAALTAGEPLIVMHYGDFGLLDAAIDEVRSLIEAGADVARTEDIDDLFTRLDTYLLFTPLDEAAAVAELDGRRDALLARTVPAMLFLLRGGSGDDALRHAPGLASWVRQHTLDPEVVAAIDPEAERGAFEVATGQTPEAWLARFGDEDHPDDPKHSAWMFRAMLLAEADA